jgi:hypothetical protein
MKEYLVAVLFLVVIFVAFALFHGNRRCIGCSGDCDKSSCEKRH